MAQKKTNGSNAKMTGTAGMAAAPASRSAGMNKPMATEIRNTAVPPKAAGATTQPASRKEPSWEQIAQRAYFIWQSRGGSEMENWLAAERELRAK